MSYELYRDWCLDHGHRPPSRSWWNKHCVDQPNLQADYQFDHEVETREGWTNER
jgi:hypothetical protein